MGLTPEDLEPQAQMVMDRVQSGLDVIEEYAGPLLDRYGRTAIVVGVAAVAAIGVALIIAKRRRRPTLTRRLQDAVPDAVSSRLRSAADRISR